MLEHTFNNLITVLLYRWLFNTCGNCELCDIIYSNDEIEIEN